jgi:Sulfotransferase domain
MTLKVIGAAFGRTGTASMREALTLLGLGPCHHMVEVNTREDQKRMWRALVKGALADWDQLLAGYVSCVDWPAAAYWRELMQAYPEATVLLTYRTPESWWDSFEKTVLASIQSTTDQDSLGITLIRDQVFGGRPHDRAHAIAMYEQNVRLVKATVPAERLLVHHLGDGWEPLCAHLGLPVPEVPYPRRNSASEFIAAKGKPTFPSP